MESRFSDEKLEKFYKDFHDFRACQDRQIQELIQCNKQNTEAINRLSQDTEGVVKLYQDMQSATRLGVGMQKFGLWVVKWPLIGAGVYAIYKWITKGAL